MSVKEALYAASPVWMQNVWCDVVGAAVSRRRYGRGWDQTFSLVMRSGELGTAATEALVAERLERQFEAAKSAPFWSRAFDKYGVRTRGSSPFVELAKLPVLTKDVVRANVRDMLTPPRLGEERFQVRTSGSTGSPLRFATTRLAHQMQWAVWWRFRGDHGIHRGDWNGSFGGKMIVPRSARSAPYWRRVRPDRRWFFSSYHINRRTARAYVEAINELKLTWLHGYPSALSALAAAASEGGMQVPPVRLVTTGSETLLPNQRELLSKSFGAAVRQHYGLAEGVANFSECREGVLHVDEDYGYVEFVDSDRSTDSCAIIGTNLTNPAFPLFRYDTGDLARIDSNRACGCGRTGRIVDSVDGRIEDAVILADGTRVGRLSVILTEMDSIREAQFVQKRAGAVIIRVAKGSSYDAATERRLLDRARARLGDDCMITIEYVDSVPRTASGKIRLVVSNVA